MTHSEELSIRGQLAADKDRLETELALRRDVVHRLAGGLRQAADVLEKNALVPPSGEDCLAGAPPTQQLPEVTYRPVFNYGDAVDALVELKKARIRVQDVIQRESLMRGRHSVNTI